MLNEFLVGPPEVNLCARLPEWQRDPGKEAKSQRCYIIRGDTGTQAEIMRPTEKNVINCTD